MDNSNKFYQKLQSIFETSQFKEFANEYLSKTDADSASMFFIYFFTVYSKMKTNKILFEESDITELLHQWISDSDIRH